MITTFYPPYSFGGDGIFVHNLANELAARGHEVDVVHCRDAYRALARGEPTEPSYSDRPGVTVHGLESRVGALSPLATHQTGRPLFKRRRIRHILEAGFDVIHYHNISLVGGPKLLEYGRGVKLYTFHEYWLVCPTHLLFRFNRAPCTRRLCTPCAIAHHRPPQWWRATGLIDAATQHVDAFLSPSRFAIETHRRLGLAGRMVHLPSFVPTVNDLPSAATPGEPYFLYVGRLEHAKGSQTLVPWFRRWGRARLLLAGAGREEGRLRRLAGDTDRVRLLGVVRGRELRALYRGATAVIVPSLSFEILPLVILEAFRESTPVVVRNRGALREAVEESGGGLVYDDDDQLQAALDTLLRDTTLRDELGRRGHAHYRAHWSTDAHLQRYLTIIEDVMSKRSPGGRPA